MAGLIPQVYHLDAALPYEDYLARVASVPEHLESGKHETRMELYENN